MHDDATVECRQIAELLGDYFDGSLPRETRELLEWHIDGCAPCVAFVNTYKGTVDAARKLREVEIPRELKARLVSFLKKQGPSARPDRPPSS